MQQHNQHSQTNTGYRIWPVGLFRRKGSHTRAVSGDAFVEAMRGSATGVNIVTTDGPAGRFGLTVSAFSSVSAEPPSVLVCVNQKSPACAAIRENRQFCVNVLSTEQRELANTFAGMPAGGDPYDFDRASWKSVATNSPVLEKSVAGFDCVLNSAIDAGTHTIFIGVVSAVTGNNGNPLLYTNRSFRRSCCDA